MRGGGDHRVADVGGHDPGTDLHPMGARCTHGHLYIQVSRAVLHVPDSYVAKSAFLGHSCVVGDLVDLLVPAHADGKMHFHIASPLWVFRCGLEYQGNRT